MKKGPSCRFLATLLGIIWLAFSGHAFGQPTQPDSVITKGAFVERYFLNEFTRPPAARRYVPADVENLPPAERYQAVVKGLTDQGVLILAGSNPDEPLTRVEFITLTYLLAGGRPTNSLGDQKALLKERGVIDPNDIGIIKSFQGDVTVTRSGKAEAIRITGAEPVLFKDLDETEFGARLELQFDDGSTLAIGEDTSVNIDEMVYDPKTKKRSIRLRMTVGTILVNAAKNNHPESKFEVITPTLVAGVRGTKFGTKVESSGRSAILTTEGSVVVCLKKQGASSSSPRNASVQCDLSDPANQNASQGEIKGVLVNAGQITRAGIGDNLLQVAGASESVVRSLLDETRVVGTTQVARISSDEAQKTEDVVQVEIKESGESTVQSEQETSEQRLSKALLDDRGDATEEVNCILGLNCPSDEEELSLAQQLSGLSGEALKSFFLSLTDQQQADLFGVLTSAQQTDLVSLLNKQEAQNLLARFQPNSPFTDSVLKSLLDFGAVLSSLQVGQLVDNLTDPQATEYIGCDGSVRDCIGDLSNPDSAPVGVLLDGTQLFGLTPFGTEVAESLRQEILEALGITPSGTGYVHLASLLTRTIGNLDPADVQEIGDIFGNGFLDYTVNGGVQAGELLENPNGPNAGQKIDIADYRTARRLNEGFFAYVDQLDEDFSNAAALKLIDSASQASFTSELLGQANNRKSLQDLVTSQMELSSIRERDGRLQTEADARAGAVIRDQEGRLTRISQYVLRPQDRPDEIQMINITDTPGSNIRMAYIDFRTRFTSGELTGLSSTQIRDLPWNDYLTTLYSGDVATCQATLSCTTMVGSPAGSPELDSMSIQQGHGGVITDSNGSQQSGFFTRVERKFEPRPDFGFTAYNFDGVLVNPDLAHQHLTQETITFRGIGTFAGGQLVLTEGTSTVGDGVNITLNDPRAGSTLSTNPIPTGEFRTIPRRFAGNNPDIQANPNLFPRETQNPEGFIYQSVGAFVRSDTGATIDFTNIERFRALGTSDDPTPGANVVIGLSGVQIDNIWDALRVGQPGISASGLGQGLPTVDIGGNLLQFRNSGSVLIPWNRMIWKGDE